MAYSSPLSRSRTTAWTALSSCVMLTSSVENRMCAVAPRGIQEHRFKQVLRCVHHRTRACVVVVGPACRTAPPGHQPGDLLAGEAGGPHVVAHEVAGRGEGAYPLLDAQVPEDLAGALVGDVGAGGVRGAGVLRHRDGADAISGEQRAGRQSRRPGTNDENVGFAGAHGRPPADVAAVTPSPCREALINVNGFSKFCRMLCHAVASCPEGGSRDETVVSSRDDPPAPAGAQYQRAFGAPEPVRDAHVRTRGAPAGRPAGRRAETWRAAPACDAA